MVSDSAPLSHRSTVSRPEPRTETTHIEVAVRLRPASLSENRSSSPIVTACSNTSTLTRTGAGGTSRSYETFDHVHEPSATQADVFESVEPFVDDVMKGYEATIFAYGQTGTGKTYTMEGDLSSDEQKGVIPRAVERIFEQLREDAPATGAPDDPSRSDLPGNSSVKISYLEIYNEELRDLLTERTERLEIREDVERNVFVQNLSEVQVCGARLPRGGPPTRCPRPGARASPRPRHTRTPPSYPRDPSA